MHRVFIAVAFGFCIVLSAPLAAHEGLHEVIAAKTKQIAKDPSNARLYLDRGELYRAHTNWDAAFVDYEQAAALDASLVEIDLARGRMLLEAGWFKSARFMMTRFLNKRPNDPKGRLLHAQALSKLGEHLASVAEYTRAIKLTSPPVPELYIWRAETLEAAGESYIEEALRGLDEGMRKFGQSLVTLQLPAIELELKQKRYDAALKRLDTLAAQSARKESWLARRGEILELAGRFAEAKKAFSQALQAIESLPVFRRKTQAVQELETRVRAAMSQPHDGPSSKKD